VLGKSPCDFYKQELTKVAKEMLLNTPKSINEIAKDLTFDPANFNRFFQRHAGTTPGKFRKMR
jgi:AraC family transcriptional regulator, regulatory protein of adaptative response / methylphosphotriester-DNA alkyltransferase methyltransferase